MTPSIRIQFVDPKKGEPQLAIAGDKSSPIIKNILVNGIKVGIIWRDTPKSEPNGVFIAWWSLAVKPSSWRTHYHYGGECSTLSAATDMTRKRIRRELTNAYALVMTGTA